MGVYVQVSSGTGILARGATKAKYQKTPVGVLEEYWFQPEEGVAQLCLSEYCQIPG
ncbi:hypothetical protein AG1IA_01439 [Rhizoctonia solani AG-1 IA]|uniref:Uncharacterized protein n=1 Tax=Thanatephorus cucumeris (strain AG1-IA) TaxID=983506 RepID=L8X2I3_THACA|nr:hypothetical protein AG1IA_01439 [Rhizoctonia solani AG-1 IA]